MWKREAIGWKVWDMKTLIKGAFDSTLTRRPLARIAASTRVGLVCSIGEILGSEP